MTPAPTSPHDLQSIGVGVTLLAALCVHYWRLAIRLVVIAGIALATFGAILLIEVLPHTHR
jgi:xanthine/uracil permease